MIIIVIGWKYILCHYTSIIGSTITKNTTSYQVKTVLCLFPNLYPTFPHYSSWNNWCHQQWPFGKHSAPSEDEERYTHRMLPCTKWNSHHVLSHKTKATAYQELQAETVIEQQIGKKSKLTGPRLFWNFGKFWCVSTTQHFPIYISVGGIYSSVYQHENLLLNHSKYDKYYLWFRQLCAVSKLSYHDHANPCLVSRNWNSVFGTSHHCSPTMKHCSYLYSRESCAIMIASWSSGFVRSSG